jgi:hypothetical protein
MIIMIVGMSNKFVLRRFKVNHKLDNRKDLFASLIVTDYIDIPGHAVA